MHRPRLYTDIVKKLKERRHTCVCHCKQPGRAGCDGFAVRVEADVSSGLPQFAIVGLPDSAVKESADRVRSALKNLGFSYPASRVTVNLAPAHVRQDGPCV